MDWIAQNIEKIKTVSMIILASASCISLALDYRFYSMVNRDCDAIEALEHKQEGR